MDNFKFKNHNIENETENNEFKTFDLDFYRSIDYENRDLIHDLKLYYRVWKRKFKAYIKSRSEKKFTSILYVTADCPLYTPNSTRLDSPIDYIVEIQKQYPEINTRLLIPLFVQTDDTKHPKKIKLENDGHFFEFEKTSIDFEIISRNKNEKVTVYKHKNESNITVYGLYSQAFSLIKNPKDINLFQNSIPFMRAVRTSIKLLFKDSFSPEIIHVEKIPFFLGSEFERKFPANIKILQITEDFIKQDFEKQEPFWAFINLADKQNLKKLCRDSYIKKCFSDLFKIPETEIQERADECLTLIYQNYSIFHKLDNNNSNNVGDIIFKRLNDRTEKLFPNLIKKGTKYYYPILGTINNTNFWVIPSKTCYSDLYEYKSAPDEIMKLLIKTIEKSSYTIPAVNTDKFRPENGRGIYHNFNFENYREERIKNKKTLIKEFSSDRLKLDFIDKTLFKNESASVYGYLDSFYEAPLLFANPDANTFGEGLDILFPTILKLFERSKNIQVIICIKDGMKNSYVKSVIDFLNENRIFMGRWIFIDGEINLPKFFSGSDMFLLTSRMLNLNMKHLLGMHYGCVPVAVKSGIYNDTVIDIYENIASGNGFKTKSNVLKEDESSNIYIDTLTKALELYNQNPSSWNIIIKNCFTTLTDWNFQKLERYNRIYQEIL